MDDVGAIIVECGPEGQVGNVIQNEKYRKTDYDNCAFFIIMIKSDVKAKSGSIEDAGGDVKLGNTVFFELLLEFSIMLVIGAL